MGEGRSAFEAKVHRRIPRRPDLGSAQCAEGDRVSLHVASTGGHDGQTRTGGTYTNVEYLSREFEEGSSLA